MTDLTVEPTTERHESGHVPDPPDGHEREPADPPSPGSDGVELTRLLALARLTASQALEIGAGVLAEAATRPEPDTGGPGGDQVTIDRVVIGADGRVVLGPAADGRHGGGRPAVGPAGPGVAAVLADVAGAARLRGRRADPAAERLLAELDRATTEVPVAGVPVVERRLRDAAAPIDRTAVRAELAALVAAVRGSAGSAGGTGRAGAPSAVVRTTPAWRDTSGESRAVMRRIGAWLLSLMVLAAVVILEVAVLRDDIARDIDLVLDAGRSGAAPSAAPEPDGVPIEPPAPAASGSVTAVDLRPLAECAPGAPCPVRLLVRLLPGADPQAVTWSYRIVDRCTGATETAPGGSVAVPAEGDQAAVVGTVTLPAVQAVAVVAVTHSPAAAAAEPVFVGSCTPDRQAQ